MAGRALYVSCLVLAVGCSTAREELPGTVSLVEAFDEATLDGATERSDDGGVEWNAASGSFSAGPGVEGLEVVEGELHGRTQDATGVVTLELPSPAGVDDTIHAVEVRARVTAGRTLSVTLAGAESPPLEAFLGPAAGGAPWGFHTPLVPGDEARTYAMPVSGVFTLGEPLARRAVSRIYLRPSDEPGSEFAVESVRLIFREARLAAMASGPAWAGLGEIYRESLVLHGGEAAAFDLAVPQDGFFDGALGTPAGGGVGARLTLEAAGEEPVVLLRRTLTTPERWESVRVDLAAWAGRQVRLSLEVEGDSETAVLLWGAPTLRSRVTAEGRPRVVVLFVGDTLRKDHLPFHGHERENAPHLAAMAEQGALFLDTVTQGTWTKVSVPSILSSTYPTSNGIRDFPDRLPASAVTLAEVFREAGYATWATSSVPFSGQLTNLQQGVETLHEVASVEVPEGRSDSKTARPYVDRLLEFLDEHPDVPVLAFVHAMDPHAPYRPDPPYDALYSTPEEGARWEADVERVRPFIASPLMQRFGMPTREELAAAGVDEEAYLRHERNWYDASIRAMDAEVGRLLERLGELGLRERSIVAFTSDHGEEFLDHGRHWHGPTTYGEMTSVPLLLWSPNRIAAGTVVERTVQSLDLMPTLVELAGLEVPPTAQGRSLLPDLRGEEVPARPAYSEINVPKSWLALGTVWSSRSIVADGWKLVEHVDRPDGGPEVELFDHHEDPLNRNDVAPDHPEVVERLRQRLGEWRQWALANSLPSDAETAQSMSPDELAKLRSLGYIE